MGVGRGSASWSGECECECECELDRGELARAARGEGGEDGEHSRRLACQLFESVRLDARAEAETLGSVGYRRSFCKLTARLDEALTLLAKTLNGQLALALALPLDRLGEEGDPQWRTTGEAGSFRWE